MITPFDIEKKEFSKGVRGYSIEEVDEFLDQIIVDLEKIIKENLRLKAEIATLEQQNEKFKGSEGEVVEVLARAKELMSDISKSAEKRAEVILKNAQLDADLTVRESRDRAEKLLEESKFLEERNAKFKDSYKKLLERELENLDEAEIRFAPYDGSKLQSLIEDPIGPSGSYSHDDLGSANSNAKASSSGDDDLDLSDLEKELFGDDIDMDDRKTVVINPSDLPGEK